MFEIYIDGQAVSAFEGETLLQAAQRAGIDIPCLCHHTDPGSATTEGADEHLCQLTRLDQIMADTDRPLLACSTPAIAGMQLKNHTQAVHSHRQQTLKRILKDHFADCEAPCQQACPAGVDVQSYLYHIGQGNHTEAVRILKQTLPLPLSIGRVCPAFCESACRRALIDEPLAIRQLKRHAADLDLADTEPYQPPKADPSGKKVAIIGAGPAGLSAGFFLANQGHDVDIFEAAPKAGGWLRYGIPEYRLPKAILDREIALLERNGIRIHTNTTIGEQILLPKLAKEYHALCLAMGAQKAVPLDYPGSDLPGCYLGVDYLKDLAMDHQLVTGKKVAVVGGGNTAIDCARSARRLGAEVTLIYRRTKEEMPAEAFEIHEAEQEGIHFLLLTNPVANHAGSDGRLARVTLEKMSLGAPDASGRRRPQPSGETFDCEFDTLIAAVSQSPDLAFLQQVENRLLQGSPALSRWNTINGCDISMNTGLEKLFVIGDVRRGPATAVEAVADGRRAAEAINALFNQGLSCPLTPVAFNASKAIGLKSQQDLPKDLFPSQVKSARVKMPELPVAERLSNFAEVELGLTPQMAEAEAKRCLECGCQANMDCRLRDYASEYKVSSQGLLEQDASGDSALQARHFAQDLSAPFIRFDANRCISCGACVDICHRRSGHKAISFEANQFSALPGGSSERRAPRAGFSVSMADSDCVQCGNCLQVCPTGALVDARHKTQGQAPDTKVTSTICTYCGVGCRIRFKVDTTQNRILAAEGDVRSPVNQGMLCVKGRFGFDFINSEERLTQPLVRRNGKLEPCSWQTAISYIAAHWQEQLEQFGPSSFGALASAKATNEENFLLQKLFRAVIGSNSVDHCARLCHASTVTGLYDALGSGAMTNDIPGIEDSDLIFILGSDTDCAHPIIASRIKSVVSRGKARLLVADPKRVSIADSAELFVRHRPGTDVMLLNAIMQQILLNDWHDKAYIRSRTTGFEALREELLRPDYSLEQAARVTGVSCSEIAAMAEMLGTAKKTALYYAMGITQHTTGHDNVTAIANLQLLLGNLGLDGAGINPLRGQSNVQGACDMGALPNYFSGYQRLDDDAARLKLARAWGTDKLSPETGIPASHMMQAILDGRLQSLFVMGENPVLSDPDQAHVLKALKKLPFLVVQDIFLTETAEMADVVLPAAAFAEKRGHFTNTERRVQRLEVALQSPGNARPDWQILQLLANAMGADWHYGDEQAIWQEVTALTPSYAGISWHRTTDNPAGLQWPCPDEQHPGTRVLHRNSFTHGKGRLQPVNYRLPAELPDDDYPLMLSTGRLLEQFHTGTMTRKTAGLDELGSPRVMISVEDAERLGVGKGDWLKLESRRGEIFIQAFVSRRAQPGVLFLPFHFVEAAANKLTINALDPVAHIPEFKVCAVKAERAEAPLASET